MWSLRNDFAGERIPAEFMFALQAGEMSELVTNCDGFKSMKYSSVFTLDTDKIRTQHGRDKRVPPFTDRLRKDYGQSTDEIRIQDGRDTDKQYGLATDILRAAFARMPLVVCIANLPTRQDDSFRNKKARASPWLFVSHYDEVSPEENILREKPRRGFSRNFFCPIAHGQMFWYTMPHGTTT